MILAIMAVPLVAGLLLIPLRKAVIPSVICTALALAGMAALAVSQVGAAPIVILGRAVSVSPQAGATLAFCAILLCLTRVCSVPTSASVVPDVEMLLGMSALAGALMIRNLAIASLLLIIGAVLTAMMMPSQKEDLSLAGSRALLAVILLLPVLLVAVQSLETMGGTVVTAQGTVLIGMVALVLALAIGMGLFPFHVWLMPSFQGGSGQAAVMLGVVLSTVLLSYFHSTVGSLPVGRSVEQVYPLFTLLGTISAVFGGLSALPQRSLSRIVAYSALADLGVVMIGLGSGVAAGLTASVLHLAYRGIAATAVVIAMGVFQDRLGGDDEYHLRGALRRLPLTATGGVLALMSLVGLPVTAGFSTRVVINPLLASQHPLWAAALALSAFGPFWAALRLMRGVFAPTAVLSERREPLFPGVLVFVMGLALLILGWVPGLVPISSLASLVSRG